MDEWKLSLDSLTTSYALCKTKLRGGGSHSISTLALLRKNSEDEHLETFVEESSRVVSSSNMTADSLLSSFIYNPLPADEPESLHSSFTTEAKFIETGSDNDMLARYEKISMLSLTSNMLRNVMTFNQPRT